MTASHTRKQPRTLSTKLCLRCQKRYPLAGCRLCEKCNAVNQQYGRAAEHSHNGRVIEAAVYDV